MTHPVRIRAATEADASVIARQRAAMFSDMGRVPEALRERLAREAEAAIAAAMRAGEYHGWLAVADPDRIVAGAGVQLRRVLPFPRREGGGMAVAAGLEGIVLNVYTDPGWRGRGVATALMQTILAWTRTQPLDRLVLHASREGRSIYERLGFEATGEMWYPDLDRGPP